MRFTFSFPRRNEASPDSESRVLLDDFFPATPKSLLRLAGDSLQMSNLDVETNLVEPQGNAPPRKAAQELLDGADLKSSP